MQRRRGRLAAMALVIVASLWGGRAAQAQRGFVGKVVDDAGAPVPDADVRVGGMESMARTGFDGWFRVPDASTGLQWFAVRRVGYRPVVELLRIAPGDTVEVVLERIAADLDTVRVQARADAIWEREMRRFSQAVEFARFGRVITATDIEQRQPIVTSDLFIGIPGFRVLGGGGGARVVGRSNCEPSLVVDGMPMPGMQVNDINPLTIRLIITFASFSLIPSQYQFPTTSRNCGAIAIYTW
jgi:hypothetical protein